MKPEDLTVLNIIGGPGVGKSTVAAGLFYELKKRHHRVELVTEFAKDRIYEGHLGCLEDQIYIFGQQQRRISRLVGNVDIAITDSPIILSCLYSKIDSPTFRNLVNEIFSQYNNINFFLDRSDMPYTMSGRLQDIMEAKHLDRKLIKLLNEFSIPFSTIRAGGECVNDIMRHTLLSSLELKEISHE